MSALDGGFLSHFRKWDDYLVATHNGMQLIKTSTLRDGTVIVNQMSRQIFIGTCPLTYAEATVQRLCEEILGDVLRQLGDRVPAPSGEQIYGELAHT